MGASVPEAVLKLEEEIRFSWRLLFFPRQEEYSLMKCVRLQREAGPALKPEEESLPAPPAGGSGASPETPGFFWGRQLMTLHPRSHVLQDLPQGWGALGALRLRLGEGKGRG